jgi:hypothetical protein
MRHKDLKWPQYVTLNCWHPHLAEMTTARTLCMFSVSSLKARGAYVTLQSRGNKSCTNSQKCSGFMTEGEGGNSLASCATVNFSSMALLHGGS